MIIRPLLCALALSCGVAAHAEVLSFSEIKAPKLTGSQWWNSQTPIEFGKGKVTIVHFWTFGCFNCEHNQPVYKRWVDKYKGTNVQIVGVHTPELAEERQPANVESYIKSHQVAYPVLMDNLSETWNRWGARYWPTVYVIDKKGMLRYCWEGELRWQNQRGDLELENRIAKLLKE